MKLVLACLIPFFSVCVKAAEWVTVEGGKSPDRKFSVAVIPQNADTEMNLDGRVLLMDSKSGKPIGPLEEVDSTGGRWGNTTENVHCQWSPDSKLLIVNFRTGRMMRTFQLYRITGRRAIPLTLPAADAHPKGKVLEVLTTSSNPGSTLLLTDEGKLIKNCWGYMPKAGHFDEDYSKYGLTGFKGIGGQLRFTYEFADDRHLKLVDIAPY